MVRILVTAGPTREHLDDVRFLSNPSSGRMGHAVAAAALAAGHEVLLVTGPVERPPPAEAEVVSVVSAEEMQAACTAAFPACQIAIGVAAVADYRPARRHPGKPPRERGPWTLELVPNPDVIAGLAAVKEGRVVVGFALEQVGPDEDDALAAACQRGRDKLRRKGLDLIAVNLASAVGDRESRVVLLWADGREEALPRQDKERTAARLVAAAVESHRQRRREAGAESEEHGEEGQG